MTDRRGAFWLLAPFVAGAVVLVVLPAAVTFALAFFEYDGLSAARFTGLDNVRAMPGDAFLRDALTSSAIFLAIAVPLRLAAATGLALLLHARFRGAGAARTSAYLPTVVPEGAQALLFAFLLNPVYGPVNGLLGTLGLPQPDWIGDPAGARALFVVLAVFTVGEAFVVALAARQELGSDLHDLAALEGASPLHTLRRVTLPLMAPTLVLLACRDLTLALQGTFTAGYLITDGGPDRATLFLPIYVYDLAFEQLRYGYAAAVTLVLFLATAAVVYALHRLLRVRRFGLL